MGDTCVQSIRTIIRLLCMLEIVFVVVIYCYHGNGSDGQHVCTKYHGHTHYYQATMLVNCLREIVIKRAVAM